jgi:hypothetical protein
VLGLLLSVRPVQDQLNWIGNRAIRQPYKLKQKGIYFVFLLFCLLTKKRGCRGFGTHIRLLRTCSGMCITHSGACTIEPGVASSPAKMPGNTPGIPVSNIPGVVKIRAFSCRGIERM